jgi:hypothetical protein
VPVLEVVGDFFRSRTTFPLGSFTTISTSHPPFRYGLIFTLIVGYLPAKAHAFRRRNIAGASDECGQIGPIE